MSSLIIYITTFIIVSTLLWYSEKKIKKSKILKYIIITIGLTILIFISGCRYNVGTDYKIYIYNYEKTALIEYNQISSMRTEIGNILLCKFLFIFFKDPQIVIFTYSMLTILITYIAIKKMKYKEITSLAFFIFMCVFIPFCYNGIRQGLAIPIILLSIAYLKERKLLKFLIIVFVASLIHTTSLIIIPFALIVHYSKDKNIFRNILVFTIIISITIMFLPNLLMKLEIFSNYYGYLKNISLDNLSFTPLILQLPTLICIIMSLKDNKEDREIMILISLTTAGIILETTTTVSQYLNRLSLYLTINMIITIPRLLNIVKSAPKRLLYKVTYISYYIGYFVIDFYIRGRHQIFPYDNIFFD